MANIPQTMKAWQYTGGTGGLEKNLQLNEDAPRPPVSLSNQQSKDLLVEVISMAVNPIDYKIPEFPVVGRVAVGTMPTPGLDYCGRIAAVGSAVDTYKIGELVFGRLDGPSKYGTMAQFVKPSEKGCIPLPSGIDADIGATLGTAAITPYQAIVGRVKAGDKIFINGGSGGTGTFAIQIGKAIGCDVTVTCSTANIDFCKKLGADKVIDYKTTNVIEALKSEGQVYSLILDTVGTPENLYHESASILIPSGQFVQIGGSMNFSGIKTIWSRKLVPSFLGGGQRPFDFMHMHNDPDHYAQLAQWVKEGKIRPVIDSVFEWEEAPKAYEKLKTGRTKGKIVVHVTPKSK